MIRRMPRLTLSLFVAVLLAAPLAGGEDAPKGFVKLFNGKDLTGWKATGKQKVWGAGQGILHVSGGGGGWLMTEKQYGNFILRWSTRCPRRATAASPWRAADRRSCLRGHGNPADR